MVCAISGILKFLYYGFFNPFFFLHVINSWIIFQEKTKIMSLTCFAMKVIVCKQIFGATRPVPGMAHWLVCWCILQSLNM